MEAIYRNTVDHGVNIIGLARDAAEAALEAGRDLRGRVHCYEAGTDAPQEGPRRADR
jgi:hypothetical protein